MSHFNDPTAVATYADNAERMVPGLAVLHRLAALVLAESVPDDAHILVLGAGGGMELRALADAQPGWRFTGVDPSGAMLDLARLAMAGQESRVAWVEGLIDAAPPGPFDGAICLLTLHFLPGADRLDTLRALRARLAPGAPLVVGHHSVAGDPTVRARMLGRFDGHGAPPGHDVAGARINALRLGDHLPILDPAEDEDLLRRAGFADVDLIYAALTIRAWGARAE